MELEQISIFLQSLWWSGVLFPLAPKCTKTLWERNTKMAFWINSLYITELGDNKGESPSMTLVFRIEKALQEKSLFKNIETQVNISTFLVNLCYTI